MGHGLDGDGAFCRGAQDFLDHVIHVRFGNLACVRVFKSGWRCDLRIIRTAQSQVERLSSWRRLNLDIGESSQVPASAAWPCTTVFVLAYGRKAHRNRFRSTSVFGPAVNERDLKTSYTERSAGPRCFCGDLRLFAPIPSSGLSGRRTSSIATGQVRFALPRLRLHVMKNGLTETTA